MRIPRRPQNLRRFLVPGVLAFSFALTLGGLYFRQQGQTLVQSPPPETEGQIFGAASEPPIYQPSTTISRSEFREALELTLETNDPPDKVLEFYDDELTGRGFLQTGRAETRGSLFVKYSHAGGRVLELTLEKDGISGKTIATLYLTS